MFTDPIAQVIFTNPVSKQVWDWTAPQFPFVTGLTLAYEFMRKATMQITFDAPYQDAIDRLLIRQSPFAQGTHVRARIGYASMTNWFTEWFHGFLNVGGDGLTIDPNGMSGQISVQVISDGMDYQVSQERVPLSGAPVDMLRQCAEAMGLLFEASLGTLESAVAILKAGLKGSPWSPEPFAGLTAWEATKRIVEMLNLRMWIGPDPADLGKGGRRLWVGTEREITGGVLSKLAPSGTAAPARPTFRVRGVVDMATSTFPCFSWAPEGAGFATWLASGEDMAGKGVDISYIDTATGQVVVVSSDPKQRPASTVGALSQPGQEDRKVAGANGTEIKGDEKKQDGKAARRTSAPMPEGEPGKQRAQSEADQLVAAGSPAQTGVIASIGVPWVVPSALVNLAGAGQIYDGPYLVQKATHTYTPGVYDMSLTCMRQGAGGAERAGENIHPPVGPMPG